MGSLSVEEGTGLGGKVVKSLDGATLGRIDELFYDDAGARLKWVEVKRGLVMPRRFLIPAAGLEIDGEILRTGFTRIEVEEEPQLDRLGGLSLASEATLAAYFFLAEDDGERPIRVLEQGHAYPAQSF
jgi:hypothetical protein